MSNKIKTHTYWNKGQQNRIGINNYIGLGSPRNRVQLPVVLFIALLQYMQNIPPSKVPNSPLTYFSFEPHDDQSMVNTED